MKRLIRLIAIVLTVTVFSTITTFPVGAYLRIGSKITTRAWPGRPGGNGDGSEEWLRGSYGQTNGPYKFFSSGSGEVAKLNKIANSANNVGWFLMGTAGGYVSGPVGIFIGDYRLL